MTRTTAHEGRGVLRARPTDRHVRIDDEGRAVEVVDVRQRFGGLDLGASIAGALAALGVTVLLGAIAGSIGTIGYQLDVERGTDALSAGGLVAGLVILAAAFLVGGWVAARIARYDGGRNGLLAAVWFIVVAALFAGAGAWLGDKYDVLSDLPVPQWFDADTMTVAAIISGIVGIVLMLGAGFLGGMLGARYHARADEYLAAEERDLLTHDEPISVAGEAGRPTRNAGEDTRATRPLQQEQRRPDDRDIDLRPLDRPVDQPRIAPDQVEADRVEADRVDADRGAPSISREVRAPSDIDPRRRDR